MFLKIKTILLWPKNPENGLRSIEFSLDKVNVITGQSQTGKSALIPIIDYCLGSGKCSIPVGIIRDKTQWFGLLLQLKTTQMLIARREPGPKEQTTDIYYDEAPVVKVPDIPYVNSNTTYIKDRFNQLAELPSLDFVGGEGQAGYSGRPSFRDMAAFNFQPQHIIANPYTLYYKADTTEHREKLRTIFPLVLGAIDNRHLALKRELKDLEKELLDKKNQLEARELSARVWLAEIKGFYSQAREFGLLPDALDPKDDWTPDRYLSFLRKVSFNASPTRFTKMYQGATDRAVSELTALLEEEMEISHGITARRIKLEKMEQLTHSMDSYGDTLHFQSERIKPVPWFAKKIKDSVTCPFCGSRNDHVRDELLALVQIANDIEKSCESIDHANYVLDKEIADIKGELRAQEQRLSVVREHRRALEVTSNELANSRQTMESVSRFVGRLEQSLANYQLTRDDSQLAGEIKSLQGQINRIRDELSQSNEEQRIEAALFRTTVAIHSYSEILKVERLDDPAQIDIKNLTIRISSRDRKHDFLWEIGSGANWMGYHIATLLALHELFIGIKNSPVPTFLLLDQPSQVYFPERWPTDPGPTGVSRARRELTSDDIRRVKAIFSALSEFMKRNNGKVQVIISEHADEITWTGLREVELTERWRDGKALIPKTWK